MDVELPVTESYRIDSSKLTMLYLSLTIVPAIIFQVLFKGLGFIIGGIIGAIISLIILLYKELNKPGIMSHYINYISLPGVLAGNARDDEIDNIADSTGYIWGKGKREYSLSSYLPYRYFEKNFIFYNNGGVAFGLKLTPIYDDILSSFELVRIEADLNTFLNSIDMDLDIQIIFKKDKDLSTLRTEHLKLNTSQNPLVKMLFKKRLDKIDDDIKANELFNYKLYIFVRKKYNNKIDELGVLKSSPQKYRKEMRKIIDKSISELEEIQDKVIMYLRNVNLDPVIPEEQEIINFVASQVNQNTVRNIKFDETSDLIIDDLEKDTNKEYLYINNKYFGIITFKKEPSFVNITVIKDLIKSKLNELEFEYDIVVNFRKLNSSIEKRKLIFARRYAKGMVRDKFGNVDDDEAKKIIKYNAQINKIAEGEDIFNVEFMIVVKADTKEELDSYRRKMLVCIDKMNEAVGYIERTANFRLYLSSLPGNMSFANYRNMKFPSSYLANILPVFGPPQSVTEPLMLLRNEYNSITYLNPFSNKFDGRSGLIIGKSGSGKSFLMNLILLSYFTKDPAMVIVEVGDSFGKMVRTMGGVYRKVSLENPINLFGFNNNGDDDTIILYKTILESMVSENGQPLINDERIILEEAIQEVVKKGIEIPCLNDFIMEVEALDKSKSAPEVKQIQHKIIRYLKRWQTGIYAGFFDVKNNFDTTNPVIGFDLKEIEKHPELLELFMVYVSSIVWYQVAMFNNKVFIFDEAWRTLLSEAGGELMVKLTRTGRKEGAGIFLITQAIKDIAESKHAPAIMENIHFSYLLEQSQGADYKSLQRLLNLSERDIEQVSSLKTEKGLYSKTFVRTPLSKFMAYLIPGPFEYWMATTDYIDRLEFNKACEESNDIVKVLDNLAEKYPYGAFNK